MDFARVFHVHIDVLRIPATLYISNRFYFAYFITGLVFISWLYVLPETLLSQDTNNLSLQNNQTGVQQTESDTFEWKLVGIIASTGVISALGTGLFDRFNANKQLKQQQLHDFYKIRDERQREFISDKVGLYSAFIFYVERMIENPQFGARKNPESPEKIEDTVKDIDSLLTTKLYLVTPEEFSLWLKFRNLYDVLFQGGGPNEKRREAIDTITDFRNALVGTYNSIIIDYNAKMGSNIGRIKPESKSPKYH